MFQQIQSDVDNRFDSINSYFKATANFKNPRDAAVAKGLIFVQMYAIYENTVTSVIQEAAVKIASQSHSIGDLKPSLKTIFLHAELASLKDCSPKNEWDRRLKLLKKSDCSDLILAPESFLPTDGTHYRYTHLKIICDVFEIKRRPVNRKAHALRINEVVEHRNAIAHGREKSETVGGRYTRRDVNDRIRQMRSVCTALISIFEKHCANPNNHCK